MREERTGRLQTLQPPELYGGRLSRLARQSSGWRTYSLKPHTKASNANGHRNQGQWSQSKPEDSWVWLSGAGKSSYTASGNVNTCGCYGNQYGDSSKIFFELP